ASAARQSPIEMAIVIPTARSVFVCFMRFLLSFAEIFHPGIAHDGDNGRVRSQLFSQSQGGDDIGASGSPRKKAFLPGQPSGHGHSLFRGNLFNLVGDVCLPERYYKTRSDPINFMSA